MTWVTIVATVLRIILAWYLEKKERDKIRKRLLKEAREELAMGLRTRSTSSVFSAWDKVRRQRR